MSNPNRQIFIGNLHYSATEDDIRDAFRTLNIKIGDVRIVKDRATDRPKGYAFVDIASDEPMDLDDVITEVTGVEFYGRACRGSHVKDQPTERVRVPDHKRKSGGRGHKSKPRGERRHPSVWDD